MALDGNRRLFIGVNGMVSAFAEQVKSMCLQIMHQVTPIH
jgi:hypothetical protein